MLAMADDRGFPGWVTDRAISVDEVARRLMLACKTIRALPDTDHRFLRGGDPVTSWLPVVRDFMDAYDAEEARIPKFRPSPRDVSDVLVALGWCRLLSKNEFRLIWWHSFDNVSFATIAARIGRSDETARTRYRDAILKAWSEANSAIR